MPSLHMAWTLLVWWYSRGLSRAERLIAFVFLALTAFATMGTGEHWFIDLVVAFPFALFVDALCAYQVSWKDSRRLLGALTGLGVTLAWFASLRYGAKIFWISPIIPWTASAATVAFAYVQQAKLGRLASAPEAGAAPAHAAQFDLESAKVLVD
jgi:PAP2 superfamily